MKYLSSKEYQIKHIGSKKEFYETLFEKLFSIQEDDLLKSEEVNHPISKS